MKTPKIMLCVLLLFIGCNRGNNLTFEPNSVVDKACSDCPEIELIIPRAMNKTKLARKINTTLEEELINLLVFDEEIAASSLTEAVNSFKNGFQEMKARYPDESEIWEAKIKGELIYESKNILTFVINSYLFTGGAHGYTNRTYLNFDKRKGNELEIWELFDEKERFEHFAEIKFRIQEGIAQDDPINSTGFMFENDAFYLPENIGFTKDGLVLLYNQYEVASYADGVIELTIPFNEVENYLSRRIKP